MRSLRPNRTAEPRRRAPADRRARPRPRTAQEDKALSDERRLRDAGGPEDVATYTCTCGYVFEAQVSTSVACPHCGDGQAW